MLAVDPRLVRADRLALPPAAADGTYGDPDPRPPPSARPAST
jgi:hypothetical protein